MGEQTFLVAENDETLFSVKNCHVYQIATDKNIFPLPFSKDYVGGFFLSEEFIIPVVFLSEEGFGEYSGTLLVLNFQGNYLSLPVKRILEFFKTEPKAAENIEKKALFTEEIIYKDLFEIPVLDIEKLYKLTGFH
ncbi:MAG: hypothetical protein N2445_04670 [Acidobacteria bacterium]|nr:hypothetical protein [Acidobacteriota bacterium]